MSETLSQKWPKGSLIFYWLFTLWLALGMLSTGIVQLIQLDAEVQSIQALGYPLYLLTFLGLCKIAGVIVVLLPGLPVLKEWSYAGFGFAMSGAIYSHLASGHGLIEILPALLLFGLTLISWLLRPVNRTMLKVGK